MTDRAQEIQERATRWVSVDDGLSNSIPASPDDILWLLSERAAAARIIEAARAYCEDKLPPTISKWDELIEDLCAALAAFDAAQAGESTG